MEEYDKPNIREEEEEEEAHCRIALPPLLCSLSTSTDSATMEPNRLKISLPCVSVVRMSRPCPDTSHSADGLNSYWAELAEQLGEMAALPG